MEAWKTFILKIQRHARWKLKTYWNYNHEKYACDSKVKLITMDSHYSLINA